MQSSERDELAELHGSARISKLVNLYNPEETVVLPLGAVGGVRKNIGSVHFVREIRVCFSSPQEGPKIIELNSDRETEDNHCSPPPKTEPLYPGIKDKYKTTIKANIPNSPNVPLSNPDCDRSNVSPTSKQSHMQNDAQNTSFTLPPQNGCVSDSVYSGARPKTFMQHRKINHSNNSERISSFKKYTNIICEENDTDTRNSNKDEESCSSDENTEAQHCDKHGESVENLASLTQLSDLLTDKGLHKNSVSSWEKADGKHEKPDHKTSKCQSLETIQHACNDSKVSNLSHDYIKHKTAIKDNVLDKTSNRTDSSFESSKAGVQSRKTMTLQEKMKAKFSSRSSRK